MKASHPANPNAGKQKLFEMANASTSSADNKIAEVAAKYSPPLEAATTTATIATIATVSALVCKAGR